MSSWMTLFLSTDFPQGLTPWYYVFGNNETHVALPLGYGPVANHHESANARNVWSDTAENNIHFTVRGFS